MTYYRGIGWVQFGAYSATLLCWLLTSLRPRHPTVGFWIFVAGTLVVHTVDMVAFILYVRRLGPIDYVLFGPLEGLVIALLLRRGRLATRILRKHTGTGLTS